MKIVHQWRHAASALAALALIVLAGCASKEAVNPADELSFNDAVDRAADNLFEQAQPKSILDTVQEKVGAKVAKRTLMIDPMVDGGSGQQTEATKQMEQRLTERIGAKYPRFQVVPFDSNNVGQAESVLNGTMTRALGAKGSYYRIDLSLTELKSGNITAHGTARAQEAGISTNPTPYYRDSPIVVKDGAVDGYVRTASMEAGRHADPAYLGQLGATSRVNEATSAYDQEQYQKSLELYKSASTLPGGDQLRVLTGIYMTNWKLGHTAEAEQAFGKVVALGLASNNLGVKFLFNPGTTDFWSDPKLSGPYALWLRQIAQQAAAAKVCMAVIGHTSKTGTDPLNDRLSQSRAAYIKARLEADVPELASRTKAQGMGSRQTIVGTGTDDARDALDRRVEFKISSCR